WAKLQPVNPTQIAPPQEQVRPAAPPALPIERLMLDFLAYLELERGLSRNTLEAYRSDLLQFGAFLDRRGMRAEQARHGDLAAFISELAGTAANGAATAANGVATAANGGSEGARGGVPAKHGASAATLSRKV